MCHAPDFEGHGAGGGGHEDGSSESLWSAGSGVGLPGFPSRRPHIELQAATLALDEPRFSRLSHGAVKIVSIPDPTPVVGFWEASRALDTDLGT